MYKNNAEKGEIYNFFFGSRQWELKIIVVKFQQEQYIK